MAKKPHNSTRKKAMLDALKSALGIVSIACKNCDVDRGTHYDWLRADPSYASAVSDLENVVLDFGESALHKLIKEGDTAATIFFLKTKGKKRGYVERSEHHHLVTEKVPEWLGSIDNEKS